MPSAESGSRPFDRLRTTQARPPEGLEYHQLQRLGAREGWRPFAGVLLLFALVVVIAPGIAYAITSGFSGRTAAQLSDRPTQPSSLAATNLTWALAIGAACLVAWLVNRQAPRWLFSVLGRFRWRWFAVCLVLSLVALGVASWVAALLPSGGDTGVEMSGHLNAWGPQLRDFLLVVVLLTPLQAAGEEFAFRGYLTQALGSLGRREVAVVVPAVIFALAHSQSWQVSGDLFLGQPYAAFCYRLAFGLVSGCLVIATGGLEAGIAMHVLNNYLTIGFAALFGNVDAALHPSEDSWWSLPSTLVLSLLYLGLCWWAGRRMGIARRTGGGILAGRAAAL